MQVDGQPGPSKPPTRSSAGPKPRAASEPATLRSTAYQVGYVYSSKMMTHSCARGHPEQPERISRIFDILREHDCLTKMKQLPIRRVLREEALLVHSTSLWEKVLALHALTAQDIADSESYYNDLSLYVHQSTPYAAQLSAGGVIEACLAVARGEVKKAFAIVRPPGHHAEPDEHMGFCFFNNVAIATKVVQMSTPIKRILILDWYVTMEGNGTQRAFYDDPSVLYISLHRYEGGNFYPNGPFGAMTSTGEGAGVGFSVNIPWPESGMGDADYLLAFQKIIMPIALEFAPELIIISAGFDAADGDDLGECHVSPAGYAHMTSMLCSLAGGKVVVALEGGYCLDAIAKSALAVAQTILGEAPPQLEPLVATESGTETIYAVAMEQSKYWKNLDPKKCEPIEEMEPVATPLPELLKAYRQEYLFQEFGMVEVPLMQPALVERFKGQIACSSDIMDNETLVVFVHELGNVRVELSSVMFCGVHEERSYLVDCTKELMTWAKGRGYAMLDVNVLERPNPKQKLRHTEDHAGAVLVYLWDNYIQLSDARRIILIGHGPGCAPVMSLIQQRPSSVMRTVRGVVQVVGLHTIPATPRDMGELRQWYYDNSIVIVPNTHNIFHSAKMLKKHGTIFHIAEEKPIKLIIKAMPGIQTFVEDKLGESAKVKVNGVSEQ
ncbi:histone deacetylase complex protein [Polyporus arcularius HHB13444]|uniref:histone deacetylase n=1 Tax=Polyporus arcularius HHB13444 TaxID=1314778 RepID=A0A5C3P728_9APHY|nr:histone deacetylase complex protein [Polyporus arcularius HHB13444]